MRLLSGVLAFVVASLPVAFAQDSSDSSSLLATLPACALKCMATSVSTSTCDLLDTDCVCKNEPLQADIEKCVLASCTVRESLSTKNTSMTLCGAPIRNRQHEVLAMNNILGTVSGIFVLQRFATKLFFKLPLGLDDLFIGLSMIFAIPCITINSHGLIPNGMGRDIWTVEPDQITEFGKNFFIMAILYFILQTFLKLAMLFFYLRIFPTRGVRRTLWATVVFNCIYGLTFVFIAIFQCRPISHFWTKWEHAIEDTGTCMDINAVTWSSASINIALDVWILSIPLSQLKKMNLDWRKKIGVGIMFSVGTFVTIMSILRLSATIQARSGVGSNNATWGYTEFDLWSTIEINVGIICACMPSLRVLLVHLFPKVLGSSTQQKYYNYGSNKYGGFSNANTSRSRSRSQPLGTTSQVDKTAHRSRVEPLGITCDRTYEVEFGQRDTDETQLVYMKDLELDRTSAKSGV
ncbi:integral membrane [Fusarium longipes]|uniref:Integral membrane n=1 Tax=Fusarium longipes TaxID=694270 RepID=A0A395T415_9HYPO|nr:integral membrane [Fusarium longipes]